jgi:nicotinate-nucleotide adenylyltransferase
VSEARWLRPPGPVSPGLRIGLLGGSLNPAHVGHLHISETARKRLGLDYVWWLVSPQNPLKSTDETAPIAERLQSARAVAHGSRIVITDIEAQLGTRYTADTLAALQRRFPAVHFVWLMGSDNLKDFHRWRRWNEILRRVPIAVIARPGSAVAALRSAPMIRFCRAVRPASALALAHPPAFAFVDGARNPQSSTAIRRTAKIRTPMAPRGAA